VAPGGVFVGSIGWHSLGSYRSRTGLLIVTLSDAADGDVVGDAILVDDLGN
jgi:hypothetical protein